MFVTQKKCGEAGHPFCFAFLFICFHVILKIIIKLANYNFQLEFSQFLQYCYALNFCNFLISMLKKLYSHFQLKRVGKKKHITFYCRKTLKLKHTKNYMEHFK